MDARTRIVVMADRYGHQGDLFEAPAPAHAGPPADGALQWIHIPPKAPPIFQHTKESIREVMLALIAELRGAGSMPWDEADFRYNVGNFGMCATWFAQEEIAEVVEIFEGELARLGGAPAPDGSTDR